MSGIAGMIVPAGRAVDERLLQRMAAAMADRGPDGSHTWIAGPVGFAHALLRTSDVPPAPQPATLDGCVRIVADARVDGRDDLVRKLEAAGRGGARTADDAELILHAYEVWGEDCVDHLLGDFAFAIWDGRRRRLFCARDHFGIKPFYYAAVDGGIVFSNSLDCVRLHPGAGDTTLNELAIADFLLFGFNQDLSATAFARIRRLPPAHAMSGAVEAPRVRRYWTLPAGDRVRYDRSTDYVDAFRDLLRAAVADRIRDSRPAIWMSGGLDSTAIAATAQRVLDERGAPSRLRAYTVVYESLFHDEEQRYAESAARALGVSTRFLPADGGLPFDGWDRGGLDTPEPIDDPYHSLRMRQLHEVAASSRVALVGDGGDEVFWRPYVLDLVGQVPFHELAADLARCVFRHRVRPAIGVRAKIGQWRRRQSPLVAMPGWLNPDFAARHDLGQRFGRGTPSSAATHTVRPEAQRRLSSPLLHGFLEGHDPGITRVPLEHRWPFLDVRLVKYLLAIPPLPWCVDKQLARLAMRGSMPEELLRRPKSPLPGDPIRAHARTLDLSWVDRVDSAPRLAQFVNRGAIPPVAAAASALDPWMDLRPLCLNYWLCRLDHVC